MPNARALRFGDLGLLFVNVWIYCVSHRPEPACDAPIMTPLYLALSVSLLVVFALSSKMSARAKTSADVASALLMALAGVLVALPVLSGSYTGTVVAAAAGGVGVGWAYARWCEFYAQLDTRYAAALVFLTMALGSVAKTGVDLLPPLPAALALACCPVLAFTLLASARSNAQGNCASDSLELAAPQGHVGAPYRYYNARTVGSLARMAWGIAVYSLVVGITQSFLLESIPVIEPTAVIVHHASEVILALAMFAWVGIWKRGLNFSRTWRLILLLMVTALIFAPYISAQNLNYVLSLVRTAQTFLIILLFLTLADIARHSTYPAIAIFAAGWATYSLPFAMGTVIGQLVRDLLAGSFFLASLIVWAIMIATMLFLDETAVGKHLVFAELNDDGDDDTPERRVVALQKELDEKMTQSAAAPQDPFKTRCDALAERCGLTPREKEILELLARGRSKAYIADAFFISENTVRSHVKHLYTKLDVHSKQELLDKIELVEA